MVGAERIAVTCFGSEPVPATAAAFEIDSGTHQFFLRFDGIEFLFDDIQMNQCLFAQQQPFRFAELSLGQLRTHLLENTLSTNASVVLAITGHHRQHAFRFLPHSLGLIPTIKRLFGLSPRPQASFSHIPKALAPSILLVVVSPLLSRRFPKPDWLGPANASVHARLLATCGSGRVRTQWPSGLGFVFVR